MQYTSVHQSLPLHIHDELVTNCLRWYLAKLEMMKMIKMMNAYERDELETNCQRWCLAKLEMMKMIKMINAD